MHTLDTVKSIAREAGAILAEEFNRINAYEAKADHDVVTRADYRSESLILNKLKTSFPEYSIISEESPDLILDSGYCWYIDPLDGTSNFITGNPYFVVSIALTYQGESILGVVYHPINDELYWAEKGKGAWLNGRRISVSTRSALTDSLVALAYAAEPEKIKQGIEILRHLAFRCRRVVLNFSPAYDLCNMSRGRLDGLVDNGSTPEDHAAGSLILSEAGGRLRSLDQPGWDLTRTGILASNGLIHDQLAGSIPIMA